MACAAWRARCNATALAPVSCLDAAAPGSEADPVIAGEPVRRACQEYGMDSPRKGLMTGRRTGRRRPGTTTPGPRRSVRHRPHRRHTPVSLEIIDPARLGRHHLPPLDDVPPLIQRHPPLSATSKPRYRVLSSSACLLASLVVARTLAAYRPIRAEGKLPPAESGGQERMPERDRLSCIAGGCECQT